MAASTSAGLYDVTARIYDLSFKFQNDFAAGTFPGSLREAWVSAKLGPGQLTVGQFKAYRSMEELASSNEITMMERPSTSSTGIYSGRQWLMGVGYKGIFADQLGYGVDVMSLAHTGMPIAGLSYGGRLFWVPFRRKATLSTLGSPTAWMTRLWNHFLREWLTFMADAEESVKSLGIAGASAGSIRWKQSDPLLQPRRLMRSGR